MLFCVIGFIIGIVKWFILQPLTWSLGCSISSFVASIGWKWKWKRQNSDKQTKSYDESIVVDQISGFINALDHVWDILQPMVFGILGTTFNFEHITTDNKLYTGILVVAIGFIVSINKIIFSTSNNT